MNADYIEKVAKEYNDRIDSRVSDTHTPEECALVNLAIDTFIKKATDSMYGDFDFDPVIRHVIHAIGHIIFDFGHCAAAVDTQTIKDEVDGVTPDDFKDVQN